MLDLTFEIEGKEEIYQAPQDWTEVTLKKFIALCNIEIPEKLRNLWVASASENDEEYNKASDQIKYKELEKEFPTYYGKVMKLLTNIPQSVIDLIHGPTREEFFNKHLRYFIYSSFARYPVFFKDGKTELYDPPYKESFTLNKKVYFLPENLKVYGEEIPMGKEKAITFAEASDIEVALRDMAEGAANRLPMFVAIYCREKGEEYDEEKVMKRADDFLDLPMEEVWRVFFCIFRRLEQFQTFTQESSKGLGKELVEKFGSLA
jgi:hypothetical protein